MPIRLNLKNAAQESLPAGYYRAIVSKVEEKVSKSSGKPMLLLTFNILDEGFEGRKAWLNVSLQESAAWRMAQVMTALGYSEEDLAGDEEGNVEVEPSDFVGVECVIVMKEDEYQGRVRTTVDSVLPEGSVPDEESPASDE